MATSESQFHPRLHNDVYPFIHPKKFKGTLQNKVVIITGSAGTIGRALAKCFAVAGATLVLTYNRTAPPDGFREHCTHLGATSVTEIRCNVLELESCEQLVKQVLDTYGTADILVNNAGANSLGPLYDQDPQQWIREFEVNFHGPFYLMRLLLPIFREKHNGCILNISSRAGTVTGPYSTSYCASKAALISLTSCTQFELNIENESDIHLYALHPGGIKSEMTRNKYSDESIEKLPANMNNAFKGWLDQYIDSPYLNGMVCVALATGIAKDALKGRYFDVNHDLEDVIKQTATVRADPNMYTLHTSFLGGMPNDGGPRHRPRDKPFAFPGF